MRCCWCVGTDFEPFLEQRLCLAIFPALRRQTGLDERQVRFRGSGLAQLGQASFGVDVSTSDFDRRCTVGTKTPCHGHARRFRGSQDAGRFFHSRFRSLFPFAFAMTYSARRKSIRQPSRICRLAFSNTLRAFSSRSQDRCCGGNCDCCCTWARAERSHASSNRGVVQRLFCSLARQVGTAGITARRWRRPAAAAGELGSRRAGLIEGRCRVHPLTLRRIDRAQMHPEPGRRLNVLVPLRLTDDHVLAAGEPRREDSAA